jgi:WD40 repeat protein
MMKTSLMIVLLCCALLTAHAQDVSLQELEPIMAENAARLTELAEIDCNNIDNSDYYTFVNGIAWSPDSTLLAVATSTMGYEASTEDSLQICVYEAGNWPDAWLVINTKHLFVEGITFSPDSQTLAASYTDGTIRLWDVENGLEQPTVFQATRDTHQIAYHPDGTLIAIPSDHGLSIWDIESQTAVINTRLSPTRGVFFNLDGTRLMTENYGQIKVWTLHPGLLLTQDSVFEGEPAAAFGGGEHNLIAYGTDEAITVWDIEQNETVHTIPLPPVLRSLTFSPDGNLLAGINGGNIVLWSMETGLPVLEQTDYPGGPVRRAYATFSPDGRVLALHSGDGGVYLWSVPGTNKSP